MRKISVIIPVYKVEQYLEKCIKSIAGQTYSNLEIILVDDGSPDSCPAMCDAWAEKDPRIIVIHKQNGGLSDARNAGLDIASGEYISFVDSDDWIAPECLDTLCSALERHQADIAVANYTKIDEQGLLQPKNPTESVPEGIYTGKDVISSYFRQNAPGTVFVMACAKLYRKKIFSQYRFAVGRINEDEFAFFPIYRNVEKVTCVSDELYFYLQRGQSIMGTPMTPKRILDNCGYWSDRLEMTREEPELYKKVAVHFCVWMFLHAFPHLKKEDPLLKQLEKQYRGFVVRYIFDPCVDLPLLHKIVYFLSVWNPGFSAKMKKKLGV